MRKSLLGISGHKWSKHVYLPCREVMIRRVARVMRQQSWVVFKYNCVFCDVFINTLISMNVKTFGVFKYNILKYIKW